ncbi:MAG: hypothetical protein PVH33_12640, partial [Syntrophobacterales bacterium]
MAVPPGNRRVLVSVPERYVAGSDIRGRQEGRPYPWSQQVIHGISGLKSARHALGQEPLLALSHKKLIGHTCYEI